MPADTIVPVLPPKTAKRLGTLHRKAEQAKAELDAAIAEALEQGASTREVAPIVGRSHTAVVNAAKRHARRHQEEPGPPR